MEIDQDFKEFIQLLNKHKAEYLVVGGFAVAFHGYPRYTGDIDFWIKAVPENAKKIVDVLTEFGFGSLDIQEDDFIKPDFVIQLGFPPNRIDLLTGITGLHFDDCWQEKKVIETQGEKINFISLHHLKINKKKSGREKDMIDLHNLPDE